MILMYIVTKVIIKQKVDNNVSNSMLKLFLEVITLSSLVVKSRLKVDIDSSNSHRYLCCSGVLHYGNTHSKLGPCLIWCSKGLLQLEILFIFHMTWGNYPISRSHLSQYLVKFSGQKSFESGCRFFKFSQEFMLLLWSKINVS